MDSGEATNHITVESWKVCRAYEKQVELLSVIPTDQSLKWQAKTRFLGKKA